MTRARSIAERWLGPGPAGARTGADLRRGRGEAPRDLLPGGEPAARGGQVHHDAPPRALDPGGELEQPLAQRADLRPGTGRPPRLGLQALEEDVRGEAEEHPELIGQEAMAARPVQCQPLMQLLEAILQVAPPTVDRVDRLRRVGEIGEPCRAAGRRSDWPPTAR